MALTKVSYPLIKNPAEKVVITQKNWVPENDPIFGRSTPEKYHLAIGGHFDELGSAGRNYQWGISSWITNPGTMPVTVIDAVGQGYKVRGGSFAARQCGDDGDGHALEILSGQWAARANVTTVSGSNVLTVEEVTFEGSKFCIGNAISGTGIPAAATIVSVTKGSQTVTGNAVDKMTVVSGGTGYVVGDTVTLVGGTSTFQATASVQSVTSGGVISTLLVTDGGNYTVDPAGTLNLTGGSGSSATVTVEMITGGFGNPDSITISANATASGSSSITVLSADTLGIGLQIAGSGDGGSDGTGNPNGIGINFLSYNNAAFYRGINFGSVALRSNGTGIRFTSGECSRGISFESYDADQALRFASSQFINIFSSTGNTCSGPIIDITATTATYGLRFTSSNTFSSAAILLDSQNIDTDNTNGMKIGTSNSRKIGFWGVTPVTQPLAISDATSGTEVTKINQILAALRAVGIVRV